MERRDFIKHAGIAGILAAGVAPAAHAMTSAGFAGLWQQRIAPIG